MSPSPKQKEYNENNYISSYTCDFSDSPDPSPKMDFPILNLTQCQVFFYQFSWKITLLPLFTKLYLLFQSAIWRIKSNVDEREKIISKQSHQFLLFYFRDLLSQIWVTVYWYIIIPISCEYFSSVVLCSFNLHFLPPLKTNVTSSKDLSRLKEDIIFMKFK